MLLKMRNNDDEQSMFIPANSIATEHDGTIQAVDDDHVHKSKQLHSINDDSVSNVAMDDEQETISSTSLPTASDNNNLSSEQSQTTTNSDIVTALKGVFSIVIPGDLNNTDDKNTINTEILGQRTRERLNNLCYSNLLSDAKNKAANIGKSTINDIVVI